jgi:hypothetical protein
MMVGRQYYRDQTLLKAQLCSLSTRMHCHMQRAQTE